MLSILPQVILVKFSFQDALVGRTLQRRLFEAIAQTQGKTLIFAYNQHSYYCFQHVLLRSQQFSSLIFIHFRENFQTQLMFYAGEQSFRKRFKGWTKSSRQEEFRLQGVASLNDTVDRDRVELMMDVFKPEHFVDYLLVLFRIVTADLVEFAAQIFHKANFEGRNVSDEQITKGKVLSD